MPKTFSWIFRCIVLFSEPLLRNSCNIKLQRKRERVKEKYIKMISFVSCEYQPFPIRKKSIHAKKNYISFFLLFFLLLMEKGKEIHLTRMSLDFISFDRFNLVACFPIWHKFASKQKVTRNGNTRNSIPILLLLPARTECDIAKKRTEIIRNMCVSMHLKCLRLEKEEAFESVRHMKILST